MRKHWKVATAIVGLAAALAVGGIAGAQLSAQDADTTRNLNNDVCPQAFDLSTNGGRVFGTTQTANHDNQQPLSFGPDVYFKVPNLANGQQVIVSVQAQWRPSLAIGTACNGNDISTPVKSAFGGGTVAWTNNTGSTQTAFIMLAGNHVFDFGHYGIEASVGDPSVQDETGIAAEAAAEHFLPRRDHWTFVEGSTRAGFVEFLTLLSEDQQTLTIEYMDERGPQPAQTCTLPAHTRVTLRVNSDPLPSPDGICRDGFYGDGQGHDVSVRLSAPDEFRAERVVYHVSGVVNGSAASSASTGDHD